MNKTKFTTNALAKMTRNAVAILVALSLVFLQWPISGLANKASADAAEGAQERLEQATSIDVPLEFEHAYITYENQVIAEPATKVTLPAGADLEFTATPDSGYQIESVTATIDGADTKLKPNDEKKYKLTASEVALTSKVGVRAITAPTVESVEVSADADSVEPAAGAESAAGAEPAASATSAETPNAEGAQAGAADSGSAAPREGSAASSESASGEAAQGETAANAPVAGAADAADAVNAASSETNAVEFATFGTATLDSLAANENTELENILGTSLAVNPAATVTPITNANATVNVSIYPTESDRRGRTNQLTSDYEVSVAETLYGQVHFDFNAGEGPKSGRLTYSYDMPDNIKAADKERATLYDDGNNVAGTWEIANNIVFFYYDESWALAHPNSGGNFNFDFTLDEESTQTGQDNTFSFPGATETVTVKVKEAEMTGSKSNAGVEEGGYVTYTVNLHAQGDFGTFAFSDTLGASLDYVEGSFTLDGASLDVAITQNPDGTHTATAAPRAIAKGDHVVTYRAKIDIAEYNALANWATLSDADNTATWEYGNDGNLKRNSANSYIWVQKNIINKWTGALWQGDKILWTVQVNGSDQCKIDLGGYTVTDTLPAGTTWFGHFNVLDANYKQIDTQKIPEGASSFTYTFPADAGAKTYYIQYYTIIDDVAAITDNKTFDNTATITPPEGTPPTSVTTTYTYVPDKGTTPEEEPKPEPEVTKEVADQSQALATGIVSWHSTLVSDIYPEPEQKSGLVLQYYDSLMKWHNHTDNSLDKYYKIWFVGEPTLYANGVKLEKGVDYQFDEKGGRTYGFTSYDKNFDGESVPVAFRIRFILDSPTMSNVVTYKTPIDIYYDTKCDGTYQTYYNEGRARITQGNTEKYGKSVEATYDLDGATAMTKLGSDGYWDSELGRYVFEWTIYANRDRYNQGQDVSDLHSPYISIIDTLPEGMTVVPDSIYARVVRPTPWLEWRNASVALEQQGRTATFSFDLTKAPLEHWQTPFLDENGSCYAGIELSFQTALDPAYVVHDGTMQTLRNSALLEAGGIPLGNAHTNVTYTDSVISKTGSQGNGEPVVHYTIKVNDKGQKLDPDNTHTSVNLKDTLDYRSTVVLSSIRVTDANTGENITDQCKVTLSNNETDEQDHATSSFSVNVPDGRALVISYDVSLSGKEGEQFEVTNSATLNGITEKQTQSKQWFRVNHADASVYGSGTAISITKTDSSNVVAASARLAGAVFELYAVDMDKLPAGQWTPEGLAAASTLVNTVTTDNYGSAVLVDERTKAIQYDTLYYFKEVQAPFGYAIDDESPHFVMTQGNNFSAQNAKAESHGIHPSPNTAYNVTDTAKTTTLLKARKVFEHGDLKAGAFTFELREGGELLQTATNDAAGTVAFDNIEYGAAGTHTYTISETAGDTAGISYDTHVETVTVNVVNAGNGRYAAEATYANGGDEAVFTNTYAATGVANLQAKKTLNGTAPAAGMFGFTLTGTDGTSRTATNDAAGDVNFGGITYDAATLAFNERDEAGHRVADITYTIQENVPADATLVIGGKKASGGMLYDAAAHTVSVRVTDTGEGTLAVTYNGDTTFAGVAFANVQETMTLDGVKAWNDDDNRDGIRPSEVTVHLLANGIDTGKTATATAAGGWAFSFDGLDKIDAAGNAITYTVTEDAVTGYTEAVTGSVAEGFTITNTHVPEKTQVPVRKVWDDANDQDGKRAPVTIALLANGKDTGKTVTLSGAKTSDTFTDLPKKENGAPISYTVRELTELGAYEVPTYSADGSTLVVTNKRVPETTSVSVRKEWRDDNNANGMRPAEVVVNLLADNVVVAGAAKTLSAATGWQASWDGLAKYADGKAIAYTVQEAGTPVDYRVAYSIASDGAYVITNAYEPETTRVEVQKAWDDGDNRDRVRPASVTLHLLANGQEAHIPGVQSSVILSAASEWKYVWSNLPKRLNGADAVYTVTEDAVDGYTTSIAGNAAAGFTVTNTHKPDTTSVSGEKVWNDANNQDGKRPASVTVRLHDGDREIATTTATAESNWRYSFGNLPKNRDGVAIAYTVTEDPIGVEGYTSEVKGFTITNTYTPEKTSVSGTKTWNDANDQDGIRPDSIEVTLRANGADLQTKTVTAADGWKYSFDNLDAYAEGKRIAYTVVEKPVTGYTTEIIGFDIANTHTPETTRVEGSKAWSDDGNRDGARPTSVTVRLKADGVEMGSTEARAADGWTYAFENLPKYANGKEIAYTVSEDAVPGYEATVDGFKITNTHTPATTEVSGAKTWADADDQDGLRPTSITVNLLADGKEVREARVTADDGWAYRFTDLPKFRDGGIEIVYTVTEDAVANYTTAVSGFDITNTHAPEMTQVSGAKTWNDANNQDGKRPTSVAVRLLADGDQVDSKDVEAGADGAWSYSFTGLPKYRDHGTEIVYTVDEVAVGVEGYTSQVNGYDVTNSYSPEKTGLSGKKTWDDADDQDGKRPSSITVHLLANGEVKDTRTVTADNGWAWAFTELPRYDNGKEIAYTVSEDAVDGYTTSVQGADITNTHAPEKTSVNGEKTWGDANNQDGLRPESITVNLLADGKQIDSKTVTPDVNGAWKWSFSNLDKYKGGKEIKYEVREVAVAGYESAVDGFNITNTHAPEKTRIEGEKTWDDANNQDGKRPESITVNLLANGEQVASKTVTATDGWRWSFDNLDKCQGGEEIEYTIEEETVEGYTSEIAGFNVKNTHAPEKTSVKVSKDWNDEDDFDGLRPTNVQVRLVANGSATDKVATLTGPAWTATFDGLDKYRDGREITYTIEEVTDEKVARQYTTSIAPQYDAERGFVVTNTHEVKRVGVEGEKTWDDADNQDGMRPSEITVRLLANGEQVATATASAADGWKYAFTELPRYQDGKEITYTVSEVVPAGYTMSADGFNLKNTHTPEITEIEGAKTWDDANNQDGLRPESITVNLLANGEKVDSQVVTADDNWSYKFTDLAKYGAGEEITYTVSEEPVANYVATANGFNLVNTHTPATVEISGAKTWDDADNQDGKRPASVTVRLHADGAEIAERIVSADANGVWAYSFGDLPKFKDGKQIVYSVTEDAVEGYTTSVDGFNVRNTHVPETVEVSGTKTWNDANNQDGLRPASVTVNLLANGMVIDTRTVTAENGWAYSFGPRPKYAAGEEIAYTLSEAVVNGYTAAIDGFDIANNHDTLTTDIAVSKTWNDANDQDGKRSGSIAVELRANGQAVKTATLDAENNWSASWTGLPRRAAGADIDYTLVEVESTLPDGYSSAVSRTMTDGSVTFEVVNSYTPETTSISASKAWDDGDDRDRVRPASATLQLMANDMKGETRVLDATNGWAATWDNLPVYAQGERIAYRVVEAAVPEGYAVKIDGDAAAGFTVTNSYKPGETSVSVEKAWVDSDNRDNLRPAEIEVQLYANGAASGNPVKLSAANSWKHTWEGLALNDAGVPVVYTVDELNVPAGYAKAVAGDAKVGFVVTNTHEAEETTAHVNKAWDDADDQDGLRSDAVQVQLMADGAAYGPVVTLDAANGWAHEWKNLPKKNAGVDVAYSIDEVATVSGYEAPVTSATAPGDAGEGFTFSVTNKRTPEQTEVSAMKVWDDAENQDGKRPDRVRVRLSATVDGQPYDLGGVQVEQTLDASNNWKTAWTGLPKNAHGTEIAYAVEELDVPQGYSASVQQLGNAFTIMNAHTPETTHVSVAKAWDDADNNDNIRPTSVSVQLVSSDGVEHDPVTLSASNDWNYAWNDLPVYVAGEKIEYGVVELDPAAGYTPVVSGSAAEGFTITNKHVPDTRSITVTKAFVDADNQDGMRPAEVKVQLLADGVAQGEPAVLNAGNEWSYTWSDLVQKRAGGIDIDYTVEEVEVAPGYTAAVDGFAITNTHVPETTSVPVAKTWADDDNRDGLRPDGVAFTLYANGVEVATHTVTEAEDWSYTFTDLPKRANGEELAYTVTEAPVTGYTSQASSASASADAAGTFGFTNTHDNETTEVRGAKTWNDRDNQDGTRPTSIIVNLLADGVKVDSKTVTADDGWAYAFTGLNKFRDGGAPIVYTVDEDEVAGYTKAVDGFNLANTLRVGGLSVSKAVENATVASAGKRFTFTVTLDDAKVQGQHGGMNFVNGIATFTLADGEVAQAVDLPAGVHYVVTEEDAAGYTAASRGAVGEIEAAATATARFTNTYNATADVEFFAMKALDGRTLNAEEFTFELLEDGQVIQTAENAGDGHARFSKITYTTADLGAHSYQIREAAGNVNGVTYDTSVHDFTVSVSDNGDGTLAVSYIGYDPEAGASFENTYTPSGKVTLHTSKRLDGAVPPAGAYEFQLADPTGNVLATARNAADGSVTFPELTFKAAGTYEYAISEVVPADAQKLGGRMVYDGVFYDQGESTVVIEAIDNFDGTLRFNVEYDNGAPKTFENETAPEAKFPLEATKAITGRDFRVGDEFTFTVDVPEGAPVPERTSATVRPTSGAEAAVSFGNIAFTTADLGRTYTYTVHEAGAGETVNGLTNDPFAHTVSLTVVDAGDGTMGVTADYGAGAERMVFTNTYAATGEAVLTATKTLAGRALAADEFYFELTGDNLPATLHASAAADGTITFPAIPFTQADVGRDFHYTMREVAGTLGGVTYDTRAHDITLHVSDNGDGTLAVAYDYGEAGAAPVFENTYRTTPASAKLGAHKALVGGALEAGAFSFELRGVSANAAGTRQTATNDATGAVNFDTIEYTAPGTYEYRISEVVPAGATDNGDGTFTGSDGIIYDGAEHVAVVRVVDNGYGKLVASVDYDGGASGVSFGNIALVRTGFEFNKYYFGGVGTFDFTLTATDANGAPRTGTAVDYSDAATIVDDGAQAFTAKVQNGAFADGVAKVVFPEIGYVNDGDYYYLVAEAESDTPDMVTDKAQYLVHVVVNDGRIADTTYELLYEGANLGATTDLSFYNNSAVTLGFDSLSTQGVTSRAERTSVYPKAKKYLNDSTDQLAGGEFTFELTDEATGSVIAVATNDELGNVAFFDEKSSAGLAYDEPGTFRYTIREVAGYEANMVYDKSVILLTVDVTETDNGLVATTTYNGPGGGEPAFYNVKRGMDVTVQKVSRYGGEGLANCTYALWMVGDGGDALVQEATSDAQGYITFKNVTLLAGQKYYFKEVEAPKGHTVDPYRTAYFSLNAAGDALVLVEETASDGWHPATEK